MNFLKGKKSAKMPPQKQLKNRGQKQVQNCKNSSKTGGSHGDHPTIGGGRKSVKSRVQKSLYMGTEKSRMSVRRMLDPRWVIYRPRFEVAPPVSPKFGNPQMRRRGNLRPTGLFVQRRNLPNPRKCPETGALTRVRPELTAGT
jgi:hypothetical protein